jgi:hypothetical protein
MLLVGEEEAKDDIYKREGKSITWARANGLGGNPCFSLGPPRY